MGYVLSKLRVTPSRRPADTKQSDGFIKKHQDHGNKSHQPVQPHKAPTTFHSYSKLPLELRFMIWEHTLPNRSRAIELKKASMDIPGHLYRGRIRGYTVSAWPPTHDAIRVALLVDRASRALVFRNYVPLKLGLRVRHLEWYEDSSRARLSMARDKWLVPGHTVFMSERLGDTVVARSREVLVFPYRPARHGLDTVTLTYVGFPNWDMGFADGSPDTLSGFFDKWWACLPQQQDRDSSPVGWEAEIDFWNSTKEHDVPYVLEPKGRKPGACRRLVKNGR
ncbi:hypothetical protein INS49_001454 [Diaporthe citri]|uniref:uncharacterized protein n=1 Tax=Diaporthe citri TaxID=83186 RepID=UPI001C7FC987|nr:uncharacterized protein INS49_001454 [Diaporthe citri]KAG6367267.1 hypothetical protein INS49_001454 [Diaporthe citri]